MDSLSTVLLGGIAALLGGGAFLWTRFAKQKKKLGATRDKLAVERAKTRIESLRATRAEVEKQTESKDGAISAIDREIKANKRALVEAHEGGEGLSDAEVDKAFRDLGY